VRFLRGDHSVAIGEFDSVCVVVWRGEVTKPSFELQRAGLAEVVSRHAGRAALLCVVENSAKPSEDDERSASSEMIMAHGDRLKCVACVIEGKGFRAAVNRGALAGMVLLLRNKKTLVSVFATAREGSHWVSKHLELRALTELEAAVEQVRSSLPSLQK
jgi:hypothetical protein